MKPKKKKSTRTKTKGTKPLTLSLAEGCTTESPKQDNKGKKLKSSICTSDSDEPQGEARHLQTDRTDNLSFEQIQAGANEDSDYDDDSTERPGAIRVNSGDGGNNNEADFENDDEAVPAGHGHHDGNNNNDAPIGVIEPGLIVAELAPEDRDIEAMAAEREKLKQQLKEHQHERDNLAEAKIVKERMICGLPRYIVFTGLAILLVAIVASVAAVAATPKKSQESSVITVTPTVSPAPTESPTMSLFKSPNEEECKLISDGNGPIDKGDPYGFIIHIQILLEKNVTYDDIHDPFFDKLQVEAAPRLAGCKLVVDDRRRGRQLQEDTNISIDQIAVHNVIVEKLRERAGGCKGVEELCIAINAHFIVLADYVSPVTTVMIQPQIKNALGFLSLPEAQEFKLVNIIGTLVTLPTTVPQPSPTTTGGGTTTTATPVATPTTNTNDPPASPTLEGPITMTPSGGFVPGGTSPGSPMSPDTEGGSTESPALGPSPTVPMASPQSSPVAATPTLPAQAPSNPLLPTQTTPKPTIGSGPTSAPITSPSSSPPFSSPTTTTSKPATASPVASPPTLKPISQAPVRPPTKTPTPAPMLLPTRTPTTEAALPIPIATTKSPSSKPTPFPTKKPSPKPSPLPTKVPSPEPTPFPITKEPSPEPSPEPTIEPTCMDAESYAEEFFARGNYEQFDPDQQEYIEESCSQRMSDYYFMIRVDGCIRYCEGWQPVEAITSSIVCGDGFSEHFRLAYGGFTTGILFHGFSDNAPLRCNDELDLENNNMKTFAPAIDNLHDPNKPSPTPAPVIGFVQRTDPPIGGGRPTPGGFVSP